MQECNPPRNSRLQTHQDDGARGEARDGFALGVKRTPHRIDRFAHALKNSNGPLATTARGVSPRLVLLLFRQRNQAGFPAFLEPVTLAAGC
jgi:hypothetical protein